MDSNLISLAHQVLSGNRQALDELNDVFEDSQLTRFDGELMLYIDTPEKELEDMPDWYKEMKEKQEQDKKIYREALYKELENYPQIASIEVEYDGYGDEGAINTITILDGDMKELSDHDFPDLENPISAYVYNALPSGWENNDGSYGTVTINVKEKKINFDHYDKMVMDIHKPYED